ncbi:MAG: substrate-binding domain-containing protein [Thermodesulfobacteriota bacterium]
MKLLIRNFVGVILAALVLSTIWPDRLLAGDGTPVRMIGSKYMYHSVSDLAARYMRAYPESNLVVMSDDSPGAWEAVLKGEAQVFMTLRPVEEEELAEAADQGVRVEQRIVGKAAAALITHPDNPLNELSMEQVKKIFLGEYTDWKQLGGPNEPIVAMTREESTSGTEFLFREVVLQGLSVAQSTLRVFNHDIARTVWRQKGAIADARLSEAIRGQSKGMIKILSIRQREGSDAVAPSEGAVKDGTYPIQAPMFMCYVADALSPETRRFVDYCVAEGAYPRLSRLGHQ